jgi:acyl-CoA thioesterase-1
VVSPDVVSPDVVSPDTPGPDLRICFVGDSLVHGDGGTSVGGWVGRLVAMTQERGLRVTAYNLGVCGDTSRAIAARWYEEAERRLAAGDDQRIVFSFGVNDAAVLADGQRLLPAERSAVYLAAILRGASEAGWPALVVGPPSVADPAHTARLAELSQALQKVCTQAGAAYVPVIEAVAGSAQWRAALDANDGVHPVDAGYELLAETVAAGGWWDWLAGRGTAAAT